MSQFSILYLTKEQKSKLLEITKAIKAALYSTDSNDMKLLIGELSSAEISFAQEFIPKFAEADDLTEDSVLKLEESLNSLPPVKVTTSIELSVSLQDQILNTVSKYIRQNFVADFDVNKYIYGGIIVEDSFRGKIEDLSIRKQVLETFSL